MQVSPVRTRSSVGAVLFAALSCAVSAETLTCDGGQVTVSYQNAWNGELVCDAVAEAVTLFAQCNVPQITRPLKIEIVDDVVAGCAAVYHCGEDYIEILSPALMQENRDPDGAFIDLTADDYFSSVVVHELAHAANDGMPCPYEACVAADEYIAYSMQIMSMDPDAQTTFEARAGLDRKISADELNPIILYMAPQSILTKGVDAFVSA